MRPASDYLTLLQLAVGVNLVVDAYSSHRKTLERQIADEIEESRELMSEILQKSSDPIGNLQPNLQTRPVNKLTDPELSRYLGDASIRFYKRVFRFNQIDFLLERSLIPIGLMALIALLYTSWWPKTLVSYSIVYPACVLGLAPAIVAFLKVHFEIRSHERAYRRQANASYGKKVKERHAKRIRSKALPGELYRAMNEVRRRRR